MGEKSLLKAHVLGPRWHPDIFRLDGWMACEKMVMERIKEHYPDKYDEMYEKLVR